MILCKEEGKEFLINKEIKCQVGGGRVRSESEVNGNDGEAETVREDVVLEDSIRERNNTLCPDTHGNGLACSSYRLLHWRRNQTLLTRPASPPATDTRIIHVSKNS